MKEKKYPMSMHPVYILIDLLFIMTLILYLIF